MRLAIALILGLAATRATAADCLDPGGHLTVKGTIVQSAFTVRPDATDYRVAVQRPFMAIALDFPHCADVRWRPGSRQSEAVARVAARASISAIASNLT